MTAAQPPRTSGMSGVPNSPTSTGGAAGGGSAAQDRYQLAREAISHAEELHQRGNLSGAIREYQRAATLRTTGSSSHTVRLDGDPVPFAQFLPFAFHRGGCGKWDADNVFHVENDCTCGLARLFGGDPCPCSSCEHHRG